MGVHTDSCFVQTVSPNPILCISGWNLIWITDCPHSISQLSISDLCVHKRSFVFTECALVSMVMPLHCYVYAKNNSNSNTDVLPSRLRCSVILRLVRYFFCKNVWRVCLKATLNSIWPSRLKRISRNAIWIGFQTTYECSSKRICTNRISCSSLLFRLSKYDRISIGFAQKSDLGWQSERGLRAK